MKSVIKYLALIALLTVGCTKTFKPYMLNSGQVVWCKYATPWDCGVDLLDCIDGIDRVCQHNISILKPEDWKI